MTKIDYKEILKSQSIFDASFKQITCRSFTDEELIILFLGELNEYRESPPGKEKNLELVDMFNYLNKLILQSSTKKEIENIGKLFDFNFDKLEDESRILEEIEFLISQSNRSNQIIMLVLIKLIYKNNLSLDEFNELWLEKYKFNFHRLNSGYWNK